MWSFNLVPAFASYAINQSRLRKMRVFLLIDIMTVPVAITMACAILGQFNLWEGIAANPVMMVWTVFMVTVGGVASYALGLPRIKLNFYEQTFILKAAIFTCLVVVSGYIFESFFAAFSVFSISGYIVLAMTMLILLISIRIILRCVTIALYRQSVQRKSVLIYGAGQTGLQLAAALSTDDAYRPVGLIDDNKSLHGLTVAGIKVYSPIRLETVIKDLKVDRVVLAMPATNRPRQARILRRLESIGCTVVVLPSFAALLGKGDMLARTKVINPIDFLNREKVESDLEEFGDLYQGKTVMITGAGGSIGSELVRQVLRCDPGRIVVLEVSEQALYYLGRELDALGANKSCEIVLVLGSILDVSLVWHTIKTNDVNIIFHAAAYKHVNILEKNELMAVQNNVFGTKILVEAARQAKVERFILVSTDKAVRPTTVMGATKRLAEAIIQDQAIRNNATMFSIVRFGNVLGSNGSVVPLFDEQISRGGPVTLTHSHVTRYFMTITEAACLVLIAGNHCAKRSIFVLDMGEPVSIRRLAEQMIETAGYTVRSSENLDGDIEIQIKGLEPGEKLHEELLSNIAKVSQTSHPKIMQVEEPLISELDLARVLQQLNNALKLGDARTARTALRNCVGHYIVDEATHDIMLIH